MKALRQVTVRIGHANGLHTRVAANLVKMAAEASDRGLRFTLCHRDRSAPAENLLALVGLGVRAGDSVSLLCEVSDGVPASETEAVTERIRAFLAAEVQPVPEGTAVVDEIIHEVTVTLDRIVENLANGLVVVNARNEIILFNKAAERYLEVTSAEVLGHSSDEVLPDSRLVGVLQTGRPEITRWQVTDGILVTHCTPIWIDGRIIGAAAVFQDISDLERLAGELRAVKALKEKFSVLLDSVSEGICVTNEDGTVSYVNPAFRQLFGDPRKWSSEGPIAWALRTGQSTRGQVVLAPSGARVVADVHVVRIDGDLNGAVAVVQSADVVRELARRVEQEEARAEYLEQELVRVRPLPATFSRLVGNSGTFRDALATAAKSAASSSTILIRGDSGTGKELVAEAIHLASPRAKRPFVRLNCAAIPPTLVESELFGHEKGAFTGAIKRRLGKFELANGGTIFLDEVGTLDPPAQAKLLRVLQNRELERVGGEESTPIDVRVIAATNADLEGMVERGEFRDDLYYRLNVIGIYLPPLRERRGDIPLLVEHFITKLSSRVGRQVRGIDPEAVRLMMAYDWPGNVRQLENVLERALNLCEGPVITAADLPGSFYQSTTACPLVMPLPTGEIAQLQDYEREIIRLALRRYGSFNAAGKALGITHRTVALKARGYGLVPGAAAKN